MRSTFTIAFGLLAACASAQTTVVPNANAATSGNGGLNTFIRDVNAPRTGQLLISSSQLGAIGVGDQITGITWRLWNGATVPFPPAGANYTNYDIGVGVGVAPSARSTTYASNVVGGLTMVRSGALSIPANSFTVGGNPNTWGMEITFTTPYTYTGGNLVIQVSHTGSDITNPANTFLDCLTTVAPGWGTDFAALTSSGYNATTGADNSFTISRLSYQAVPEPASMTALALGGLALLRRRRNKA